MWLEAVRGCCGRMRLTIGVLGIDCGSARRAVGNGNVRRVVVGDADGLAAGAANDGAVWDAVGGRRCYC